MHVHVYIDMYNAFVNVDIIIIPVLNCSVCSYMYSVYIHSYALCVHLNTNTVFPKGWYHGAPPSFIFEVYAEKHCFITLMTKCYVPLMHPPHLMFIPRIGL